MTVKILIGDVREQLRLLPADHFDCVVTSPPYWGLRDYGVEGQMGLERTLGEHLDAMVGVFEDVKRVLKPTGTLWLNYGDCYATSPNGRSAADTKAAGNDDRTFRDKPFSTIGGVLKAKDLCMVPNRLAIALQEAGWWVRSQIIWHKSNPMPESVRDRPTSSHESIFLLSRSEKYYFDADSVRERSERPEWMYEAPTNPGNKDRKDGGCTQRRTDKQRGHSRRHAGFNDRWDAISRDEQSANGRNIRNVWTIATHPVPDAHFATFPPEIPERCIKAGCPTGGHVLDPFGGAGTTGLVADRLQRHATLIELNPEYAALARRRIDGDATLFVGAAE